jgi:hypothetical protein
MKTFVLVFNVVIFSLFSCAQGGPPKPVAESFAKKFTKTEKVNWSKESENEWEAEFISEGTEMSANFDNTGKWLETETMKSLKDLPAEVFKAIALQFNGFEIEEVAGIENPDFKGFEISLKKQTTMVEIWVTAAGKITILEVRVNDKAGCSVKPISKECSKVCKGENEEKSEKGEKKNEREEKEDKD